MEGNIINKVCDICNYYTEKFDAEMNDHVPFCVKQCMKIKSENPCMEYNDNTNCYDCLNRYEIFYEIDDIDHYCKKVNKLIYRQQRSVLYRGDFEKCIC